MGVNTIAASIDEEPDTIEEVYEPYLMQLGFLDRTPRGRVRHGPRVRVLQGPAPAPRGTAEFDCFENRLISALGSNLGDRLEHLNRARALLQAPDLLITRASSIYETEPRDFLHQPWFLNQVIEARTTLFPRQLLARAQKIERELGRTRTVDKGPRPIDIDILLYGESVVRTEALEVPHPRMLERRFVLEPLAELIPELRHPATKQTIRELLTRVADQTVRRFS